MHHTADLETVILVEGTSDQAAVEALARCRGRDLAAEGVGVIAMAGATNIARFVDRLGPSGTGRRLLGLYDSDQEHSFARALGPAARPRPVTRAELEQLGFFACDPDLEDELIRALGPDAVEQVIAAQGELPSFRILQNQPAQRSRTHEQQLHRFFGSRSGRKLHYARLLVEALDPAATPAPLEQLLAAI